jgi:hypothetical protein
MTRPSIGEEFDHAGEWVSLAALLDLVGMPTDPPARSGRPAPAHRAPGRRGPGLRERLRGWVRRAAYWGACPQGAWRAW